MKEQILHLRSLGKTYNEICLALGCSKGLVSYHCGLNQKIKTKERTRKLRKRAHPFKNKIEGFFYRKPKSIKPVNKSATCRNIIYVKIRGFSQRSNQMPQFTVEDVLATFGEQPTCYLTGKPLEIDKPRSYQFDHKVPVSKGGTNTIDNLGLCTREANQAKSDMTHDEFIELCKTVLIHHGFNITKTSEAPGT